MSLLFWAEIARDGFGLAGSMLLALPAFSQERVKRLAANLREVITTDPKVQETFNKAANKQTDRLAAPNRHELNLVRLGLFLIVLSFVISLAITLLGRG